MASLVGLHSDFADLASPEELDISQKVGKLFDEWTNLSRSLKYISKNNKEDEAIQSIFHQINLYKKYPLDPQYNNYPSLSGNAVDTTTWKTTVCKVDIDFAENEILTWFKNKQTEVAFSDALKILNNASLKDIQDATQRGDSSFTANNQSLSLETALKCHALYNPNFVLGISRASGGHYETIDDMRNRLWDVYLGRCLIGLSLNWNPDRAPTESEIKEVKRLLALTKDPNSAEYTMPLA